MFQPALTECADLVFWVVSLLVGLVISLSLMDAVSTCREHGEGCGRAEEEESLS